MHEKRLTLFLVRGGRGKSMHLLMWRQGHDLIIDFKFAGLWVMLRSSTSNKSIFQQELLID